MKNQNINIDYAQIQMMNDLARQSVEKFEQFKERLKSFDKVKTLEDAKKLAKNIMPVSLEINHFRIGNAKCIVINRDDMLRISIDTDEEFISYNFT